MGIIKTKDEANPLFRPGDSIHCYKCGRPLEDVRSLYCNACGKRFVKIGHNRDKEGEGLY